MGGDSNSGDEGIPHGADLPGEIQISAEDRERRRAEIEASPEFQELVRHAEERHQAQGGRATSSIEIEPIEGEVVDDKGKQDK